MVSLILIGSQTVVVDTVVFPRAFTKVRAELDNITDRLSHIMGG
jgi:hypothetical protein